MPKLPGLNTIKHVASNIMELCTFDELLYDATKSIPDLKQWPNPFGNRVAIGCFSGLLNQWSTGKLA